jgi:hypothetical protein
MFEGSPHLYGMIFRVRNQFKNTFLRPKILAHDF